MTSVFDVIKSIFWGCDANTIDSDTYDEICHHSINSLAASILPQLEIPEDMREEWKKKIRQQVIYNIQCKYLQDHLPITIPYVILKGTSAAQYYPYPEYRTSGDIDIITRREDYDQACQELVQNGYFIEKNLDREVGFVKNGIMIELHRFFASLNDPRKAQYMDDLIIANINSSHILPDEVNGLVLLEHINQHLEKGLGLRQIIDWMMFVDKCLTDEKWSAFQKHAKAIGLENLAIVTTKMCEIYMGLPRRKWCEHADEKLCNQLMNYILTCGDFGIIRSQNIGIGDNMFYYSNNLKSFFDLLQKRGMENWKAAQKHAILKPFAWLFQLFRYTTRGLKRENAHAELKKDYQSAKQRVKMFNELGVRQTSKGLVVYKNGHYSKHRT